MFSARANKDPGLHTPRSSAIANSDPFRIHLLAARHGAGACPTTASMTFGFPFAVHARNHVLPQAACYSLVASSVSKPHLPPFLLTAFPPCQQIRMNASGALISKVSLRVLHTILGRRGGRRATALRGA